MYDISKSILQRVEHPLLDDRQVKLYLKRDDLIDVDVSGNKWRKLKYNIEQCNFRKNEGILTFGGAFSNHLLATAAACDQAGLKSIGIVRGDELNETSNQTLQNCARLGMKLIFVSREEYRRRNEKTYKDYLRGVHSNFYLVPEGGANYFGMIGCQEIVKEIEVQFAKIYLAQGTSTTSCGVLMGLGGRQELRVVPVLKGYESITEMRELYLKSGFESEWIEEKVKQVVPLLDFHFGGYGKYTEELISFIRDCYNWWGVRFDPIYTGKVLFALWNDLQDGRLNNETVVMVHTGGLQGIKGVEKKMKKALF